MAASLRLTPTPAKPDQSAEGFHLPSVISVHGYLARLAALHDEAAETAFLANLLGRTPWIACALGGAAAVTVLAVAGTSATAPLVAWLVLVGIAAGALAVAYKRAIAAPFDRACLRNFVSEASAILLYAGFAWGAGLFLALPAHTGVLGFVGFTVGVSAAVAAIARARDVAMCFLGPATAMGAFAALMRPTGASAAAVLAVLAGGTLVGFAAILFDRFFARLPRPL